MCGTRLRESQVREHSGKGTADFGEEPFVYPNDYS